MPFAHPARRSISAVTVAILTIGLAACSPLGPHPMVAATESGLAPLTAMGFEPIGELVEGCGAQLGFGCPQPLYELLYEGPADAPVDEVCQTVVAFITEAGTPAGYASTGGDIGPWPTSVDVVIDFCVIGLVEPIRDPAFGVFYQGTQVVDDGGADGTAKMVQVHREPNGRYQVLVVFSEDLGRVGAFVGPNEPTHLTPEQVAANGEVMQQQAESQAFANTLIGMSAESARAACAAAGYTTYDIRTTTNTDVDARRIGLNIVDGVVIDALAG